MLIMPSVSFMPAHDTVLQYAIFGKLPSRDDFVRHGSTSHPAVLEFDGVIARSLVYASSQMGWSEETALGSGTSGYLFSTHDRRWCYFGALRPSRDRAGRLYPLVAGIILPSYAVAPYSPELSIANEQFFADLQKSLSSSVDTGDLPGCQQFLSAPCTDANPHTRNDLAREDLELGGKLLARHLANTPISRLQTALAQRGSFTLDDVLVAFIYHADLLRRLGQNAPKQVIALPLSEKQGETALDQATWLAFYRAAMGKNKTRFPDYIAKNEGRQYTLTLAPGRLGERCMGALWNVKNDTASMLDAGAADASWKRQPAWAEAAYLLGRQVQDHSSDLASLLSTVERIAGNVV